MEEPPEAELPSAIRMRSAMGIIRQKLSLGDVIYLK
jgi:hypothetical protein